MPIPSDEIVWTVVVAGGSGARFGGPKQFELLGDRRVLDWSVEMARRCSDGVVVVVPEGTSEPGAVHGGSSRAASVRAGLAAVPDAATVVCVHDAARPFADAEMYSRVIGAVRHGADGAIPGVAVADTIKVVDESGVIVATPDRAMLRAVQTPQAFRASILRQAHAVGVDATDDAALVEAIGGTVVVVDGSPDNRKLTVPDDLEWARARVAGGR